MDLELTFSERLSPHSFVLKVSIDVLPPVPPLIPNPQLLSATGALTLTAYEGRQQNLSLPSTLITSVSGLSLRNSSIDNLVSLSLDQNLAGWVSLDPVDLVLVVKPPKGVRTYLTWLYA